jgi:hypothetical protein
MTEEERNRARAKLISDISINQLIVDLKGKQFRHLVEHHMRRFRNSLPAVITASMELLTPEEKTVAEAIVDEFNRRGYDRAFWRSDASSVLSAVSCDLNDAFFSAAADPAAIFSIFQIVTGNFAWMAYEQKNLRKFAGIDWAGFVNPA